MGIEGYTGKKIAVEITGKIQELVSDIIHLTGGYNVQYLIIC